MRIGVISDLHFDLNKSYEMQNYLDVLVDLVTQKEIERLVIAGDLSNDYLTTIDFMENLNKRLKIPAYFVPGNHDYWNRPGEEIDTWKIYQAFSDHPLCLIDHPVILEDNKALVGHSFWYNHAIYDAQFSEEEIEEGKYKGRTWQDKIRVTWGKTDRDISKYFAEQFEDQLKEIKANQYILISHMVTIPEFHVPERGDAFRFFNAFIGTNDLEDIHQKYPITHSIMGHVHYRKSIEKAGTQYICCCLGYESEWPEGTTLQENMEDALFVFDF